MKRPIDLTALDGYVTGELADAEADAFEEALFDAPDDANVELLDRLTRHGRKLVAHGTFDMGVPREHIDKLRAQGIKVQVLEPRAPSETPELLTLDPTAELVCTRLPLGRPDLAMVDVELTLEAYNATKTIKDAIVDRTDGHIYGLCELALAEMAWGHGTTNVKVRERDGERRLLAEWNFLGAMASLPAS